jgi:glutathione S-transferase
MYVLYGGRFTRALLVEMVLAEGDLAYELCEVDITKDEHRRPEFLAINPAGWVPALITPEGDILYETPAINLFLAERHRLTHLSPCVEERDRGLFLSGLFYLTDDLEPVMKRYFYPHRFVVRPEDAPAMKQRSLDAALERVSVVERRLAERGPFHLGARFSLVDLTLAYWAAHIDPAERLEPYPRVGHCIEQVMARPKLTPRFRFLRESLEAYAGRETR